MGSRIFKSVNILHSTCIGAPVRVADVREPGDRGVGRLERFVRVAGVRCQVGQVHEKGLFGVMLLYQLHRLICEKCGRVGSSRVPVSFQVAVHVVASHRVKLRYKQSLWLVNI